MGKEEEASAQPAVYIKHISLVILTFQNALLIISMRYTRIQSGALYITTTAVVLSETLKMIVALMVILWQKRSLPEYFKYLYESLIKDWRDTLKLSVPAIVYMIQNNLQYVAVSHLEAAVFQVTYQLKILTTALFSVILLKRHLSLVQWGSLVMLFVGVVLVQLAAMSTPSQHQNQFIGVVAVFFSCLSSGFAGVYVEMMLKQSKASLWLRNVQLGLFGALSAVLGMLMKDWEAVTTQGFFDGYNALVWAVVVQQALGGIVVAVVVKYADNILKGFSTSLSIILSCIASVFLFQYRINMGFICGTILVVLAIYLYGNLRVHKLRLLMDLLWRQILQVQKHFEKMKRM